MNRILEMREKRGQIWDRAKAFLKEHEDENGMLSAEDAAEYERMEQEVVELGRVIDREERAAQMERELNAPVAAPLASRPEARPNARPGRGSDEYKAAFWTAMRNRSGHFAVQNALQIGDDSEGGYTHRIPAGRLDRGSQKRGHRAADGRHRDRAHLRRTAAHGGRD